MEHTRKAGLQTGSLRGAQGDYGYSILQLRGFARCMKGGILMMKTRTQAQDTARFGVPSSVPDGDTYAAMEKAPCDLKESLCLDEQDSVV
ncbi:hypothetical protein NDU88_003356 [Pleurodeles waltl]|uniref:Uncharacterized protein n=1 Tax=Pleurodeles waltl TaxID=8319 RepID=A0AAV7SFC4_PLEWA|nr:hypothetical protein NDU88_003356 [Pleurodeles waltl]